MRTLVWFRISRFWITNDVFSYRIEIVTNRMSIKMYRSQNG